MTHEDELPFFYETNECTVDANCSAADSNAVCDEAQTRCVCLHGLFRDITVPEIRCVYGKQLDSWCSSTKQCYVVDPHTSCVGNFMRSLCKCSHGFYLEEGNQTCVRYPDGEMYMVDEADKIMFFNANFLAFTVFVFLAIIILAIQKDLICDILKGNISPLNDAMNADNANEGADRMQSTSSLPSAAGLTAVDSAAESAAVASAAVAVAGVPAGAETSPVNELAQKAEHLSTTCAYDGMADGIAIEA